MNRVLHHCTPVSGHDILVVQGDITQEHVDVIVNPANSRLHHGGGVAGAIAAAGGPTIQEESRTIAPIPTGGAGITGAGNLPCKAVIHTVGPIWGGGGFHEQELLHLAATRSLLLAQERRFETISLPTISAGVFGFPPSLSISTLVDAAVSFLARFPESPVREIRFCEIRSELTQLFVDELKRRVG